MRALPEQDRRCLSLRAEGLRFREIGEVLDMPERFVCNSGSREFGSPSATLQESSTGVRHKSSNSRMVRLPMTPAPYSPSTVSWTDAISGLRYCFLSSPVTSTKVPDATTLAMVLSS